MDRNNGINNSINRNKIAINITIKFTDELCFDSGPINPFQETLPKKPYHGSEFEVYEIIYKAFSPYI